MTEISKVLTRALGLSKQGADKAEAEWARRDQDLRDYRREAGDVTPEKMGEVLPIGLEGNYDFLEPDPGPVYPADTMNIVEDTDDEGNPVRIDTQPVSENEDFKPGVYKEVPYNELDKKQRKEVREEQERARRYMQERNQRNQVAEATRRANEQERSGTVPHQVAEYVRDDQGNVVGHQDMRGHYVSYTRTPEQYQEARAEQRRENRLERARKSHKAHNALRDLASQDGAERGNIEITSTAGRDEDPGGTEWEFKGPDNNAYKVRFDDNGNLVSATVTDEEGERHDVDWDNIPEVYDAARWAADQEPPVPEPQDISEYQSLSNDQRERMAEQSRKQFTDNGWTPPAGVDPVQYARGLDAVSRAISTKDGWKIRREDGEDMTISYEDLNNTDTLMDINEYLKDYYRERRQEQMEMSEQLQGLREEIDGLEDQLEELEGKE